MQGYFNDEKREYVITDMYPRREWLNYLWNDSTVCGCDQFGFGISWSVLNTVIKRQIEGGERNLTIKNGDRNVYIKDMDTGEFYSANRNYNDLPFDKHECHVGIGYQTVVSEYKGVAVEFTICVPRKGNVTQFKIKIKNVSNTTKKLSAYFCIAPKVENGGHEAYTSAEYNEELGGLFYDVTGFHMPHDYTNTYVVSTKKSIAFDVSKDYFCGHYGSYANPQGLKNDKLSCKGWTFESDYLGVLQYALTLQTGEEWETVVACGFGKNLEDCKAQAKGFASEEFFEKELLAQQKENSSSMDVFRSQTPDAHFNSMANTWLKRQLSLGKTWGRLYGKGFRDVMQDIAAFVSLDVEFARDRIVNVLTHQYEDGNPIRMFEPDYKSPYNDSGAWIPATVLAYLYESGDLSILDEKIPYIKGDSYENAEYGVIGFFPYIGTEEKYSVFDHVQRAMDYLYSSRGERGLVLFRAGDWNDSMNNVGTQEKGESVWLTIATVKAYNEFIEILEYCGKTELISIYSDRRDELKENVIKYGKDGDHFIYGYNDYGEKIGADENEFAKIYLNPQTWAVLAGILPENELNALMDTVEERLICDYGYVQCAPSYAKGTDNIGRVSYFKKGLIENGGVYNHGVAFKIVADCLLNRGEIAYQTWRKIAYDNPKNPNNGMEPYVVSNMYIGPDNEYLAGFAPMSWVTGTAGWLYRCLSEHICGVRPVADGLLIKPCFPNEWTNLKASRIFRGAKFEIEYIKSNEKKTLLDGKEVKNSVIPVCEAGTMHKVTVYYKN